jgi:octaprenyl-diphosphate synthase
MDELKRVFNDIAPELKQVEQIILDFAHGKSPLIKEISQHLISSGGKRVRPTLLLLSTKLFVSKNSENDRNLAAAIELIHSATLLHDDVVDTSLVRRGKKTANAIWDNKASILVGDYLFSIAFQLMVKCGDLRILALLSKTSSVMSDGEVMQLENSNDVNLSREKYLEIIYGKTAVLFSAACESAALLSKASETEIAELREFGKNLGIVFQIVDDVLDYASNEQTLGKEVGHDFFEGKITLPAILAIQAANADERKKISEIFATNLFNSTQNNEDLRWFMNLLHSYKILEESRNIATNYANEAKKNLQNFAASSAKNDLVTILEYSLNRIS